MDKETTSMLTTADHVKSMLASDGWKYAYDKFAEHILDLQNINNLDVSDPTTLSTQLAARKLAVDHLWEWMKKDVIGFVEQQESNGQQLADRESETFIDRG